MATWVKPTGETAMCGRSTFSHQVAAFAPEPSAVAGRCEPPYQAVHAGSCAKSLGREKTTTMPCRSGIGLVARCAAPHPATNQEIIHRNPLDHPPARRAPAGERT